MRAQATLPVIVCIVVILLSSFALLLFTALSGNPEDARNKNLQQSEINSGNAAVTRSRKMESSPNNADITRYRNLESLELEPNNADVSRTRNLQALELGKPWDLNADGIVDILDISMVARHFGSRCGYANWDGRCDLDGNCVINILDISIVARHFMKDS